MATEQVELASVPYLTFIANKKPGGEAASYSFVLRGYVRHWLGKVWAEYDRIELTDIVETKPQTVETVPVRGRGLSEPPASASSVRSARDRPGQEPIFGSIVPDAWVAR